MRRLPRDFPTEEINSSNLGIRTYIATQVLNGLISHYGGSNPDSNAKMAIENADALIKRLNENI